MAESRSSWGEPAPATGNDPFDRAAVAPLLDALRDPLEEVRTGALRVLVRLPLTNKVWLGVGEFIGPVLAAPLEDSDVAISRLELIRAAVYVPMREMRELLHRLVDEGAAEERLEAAHALALARDSFGTTELLAQLASPDPHDQRAAAEALSMLGAPPLEQLRERYRQALDGDARFWLVVALARSGDAQAVRDYLLDLDSARVEQPFMVVTSGQPLQELVAGAGLLPVAVGEVAEELASSGKLRTFSRQIAQDLAHASLATGAAVPADGAVKKNAAVSPSQEELERLRERAVSLGARYLEEPPFSKGEPPAWDDWQLLGHLPPAMVTRLITAFFTQLAQQVGGGDDVHATLFGNQIVLLPDDLWAKFVPDIPPLLAAYAILKERDASGLAEQLAWVLSRAGLGRLLAELGSRLADAADTERAAVVSLLERAICYARWDHSPLFGGGSGAADVLPAAETFLERESQLESAGPETSGGGEPAMPLDVPDEGTPKGLFPNNEQEARPAPRKIQGRVFEIGEPVPGGASMETSETRAFRTGGEYRLDVWIGPLESDAIVAPAEFPEEQLPPESESYELKLLFWETRHMKEPQGGTITLPRAAGKSTVCPFHFSVRADVPDFEGRLQVLYGTRTLQTVILSARVLGDPGAAPAGMTIAFSLDTPVRSSAAGLDQAPPRAVTIFADTPTGQPAHITAVAENRVALRSLEGVDKTIKLIRGRLEQIALEPDTFKALDDKATQDLLRFLARQGRLLYTAIVQTYLTGFPLEDDLPIQLVSARESFLPIEFIYDRPAPAGDATLCPGAAAALAEGKCTTCEGFTEEEAKKHICPLGFWCTRRVIERHAVKPIVETGFVGAEYALETDPGGRRNALSVLNSVVYAASSKVKQEDADALAASLATVTGGRVSHVQDWTAWRDAVKNGPSMLVLLPHTLRDADEIPTLEIGELQLLAETDISPELVRSEPRNTPPVVLLLGCETAVLDIPFQDFATQFRVSGAAIVLNTLAPVLGRHVVPVAQLLVEELRRAAEAGGTFGSALVGVRRRGLAAGLPVVLSLVAYGDADWGIGR